MTFSVTRGSKPGTGTVSASLGSTEHLHAGQLHYLSVLVKLSLFIYFQHFVQNFSDSNVFMCMLNVLFWFHMHSNLGSTF